MRVKAILQELTDEIRIDGRDAIEPATSCLQKRSAARREAPVFPANSWY